MSKTEPITWQLVQFLCERVRRIDGTAGWHTDIGAGLVLDDDTQYDARRRVPAVIVDVPSLSPLPERSGQRTKTYSVEITLVYAHPVAGGTPAKLTAHRALADLRQCLMGNLRDAPLRIGTVDISDSRVETAEGSEAVLAHVSAQATVSETIPPA